MRTRDDSNAVQLAPSSGAAQLPILYVDDEPENLRLFQLHFGRTHRVYVARCADEALAMLGRLEMGVLLSDERMPGMSGIDLLARVVELSPDTIRIIVSAYADSGRLLAAMNRGHAHEYVIKPWSRDELAACIDRALEMARRRRALAIKAELADALVEAPSCSPSQAALPIGFDAGLRELTALLRRVAPTDTTVLVLGETGTGKELVARTLHALGPRASGPFVALNCAALPEGLVESELFGHEPGAFTGANKLRKGRFELAAGGTLFLDEIGDVSPRVQLSLLRALQERCIERVGGTTAIPVDVRIIAATHGDLGRRIAEGTFREDLYYRLNVFALRVPPLRDRTGDIPQLVNHLVRKWLHLMPPPRRAPALSDEVLHALTRYSWPGNVRELENMVQRALIVCDGQQLTLDDFTFSCPAPAHDREPSVRAHVQLSEARALRELLMEHGGNVSRAARTLGVPRTTLMSRAKRHGVL